MHKSIYGRFGAALLCVALIAALLCPGAAAAGDAVTLSGEISGMYVVPDGVTKVILDGVSAADFESGVKIPAAAEVVLANGSENVCGVMCMGDLHVTGGGSLVGGSGIYAFGNLTLDLTGNVVLDGGQIAAFGGSVTINSGTYRLQSLADGGGGLIVSSRGDVFLNGGDVQIYNDSVGVTSTDGAITVEKTELDISAADAAMLAQTINLPDGAQSAVVDSDDQGSGQVISAGGQPARHVRLSGGKVKAEADPGEPVLLDGKCDVGSAVSLGARGDDAPTIDPQIGSAANTAASPWLWAAVGAAAVIAAAVWLIFRKKKQST